MSELEINPKMVKRLAWIDESDTDLVKWLATYIRRNQWVFQSSDMSIDLNQDAVLVEYFINNQAKYWSESPNTRERCRNMKSAWNSWKKREDNRNNKTIAEGNYTISMAARKELERLAKKNKCSFSKVIEILLVNAKDIEHLQRTLNKPFKDKNYGYHVNTQFFATFFQNDTAHQQAKAMTQMLQQEIDNNKKQFREELRYLEEKIAELTAIIAD